jgi:hypothetical protein
MALSDEIERLREYPKEASEAFRDQLNRVQAQLNQAGGRIDPRGVDRSGELAPLPRPTIVRALIEAE